jgi:hypothetical protein
MRLKGVCYDAGVVYGMNWRPDFRLEVVRRELEIIQRDLHCNAVRLMARDPRRLEAVGKIALDQGLETWFSPLCWDKGVEATARHLARTAEIIEPLRGDHPDRVVLCVATESTLFNRGILPGRSMPSRVRNPKLFSSIKSGGLDPALNRFLGRLVHTVKESYHGPLTYASLAWEHVDWSPFDFVGLDHYLTQRIAARYVDMLRPAFETHKPVMITEFGFDTAKSGAFADGFLDSAGLKPSPIDTRSQFLHSLPVLRHLVRSRMKRPLVRDEALQAERLVGQLRTLEGAKVDGAFISTFISQINPYDPDPRFDLDAASPSLVKYFERRHGTTYPDMPWEPKESFLAVANFYATH